MSVCLSCFPQVSVCHCHSLSLSVLLSSIVSLTYFLSVFFSVSFFCFQLPSVCHLMSVWVYCFFLVSVHAFELNRTSTKLHLILQGLSPELIKSIKTLDDRDFVNVCVGTLIYAINQFFVCQTFFFLFDDLPEFVLLMSFFHPMLMPNSNNLCSLLHNF